MPRSSDAWPSACSADSGCPPRRRGSISWSASSGLFSARAEVRAALGGQRAFAVRRSPSGQAVLVHLAAPLADGSVLYLCRGSRRGLRQLFLVRHELLKLILYQSVFALLLGIFLSRHLLAPMERMSRAARRYPREPLGNPENPLPPRRAGRAGARHPCPGREYGVAPPGHRGARRGRRSRVQKSAGDNRRVGRAPRQPRRRSLTGAGELSCRAYSGGRESAPPLARRAVLAAAAGGDP